MAKKTETQPAGRSITLRPVPEDVILAIKHCVMEYNITHPGAPMSQGDFITLLVRDWVARGGQLPDRDLRQHA